MFIVFREMIKVISESGIWNRQSPVKHETEVIHFWIWQGVVGDLHKSGFRAV